MDLYYVQPAPGIAIISASIVDLDISTADQDDQGYPVPNGTARSLSAGITADGTLALIMHTNGDDEKLGEDVEAVRAMAATMSDAPDHDIAIGWDRLRAAVRQMRAIYRTDAAAQDIDQIEEQIEAAQEEVE